MNQFKLSQACGIHFLPHMNSSFLIHFTLYYLLLNNAPPPLLGQGALIKLSGSHAKWRAESRLDEKRAPVEREEEG